MRTDAPKAAANHHLHYHDGSTCHGAPTLKECIDDAIRHGDVGRVLERTDTRRGGGGEVKCYSLISGKFDHWGKRGAFVAEVKPIAVML